MTVFKGSRFVLPLAVAAAALTMTACAQQPVPVQPAGITYPSTASGFSSADGGAAGVDAPDAPSVSAPRVGGAAPDEVRTEQISGPVVRLEVATDAGRISVRGSDDPTVSVTRSIYRVPVEPQETVRHDGDLLRIESHCPQDGTPTGPCRIDYEFTVPRSTTVTIVGASGDLSATGIAGALTARSASGSVQVDDHRSATTEVESTSGDVVVHLINRPESVQATSVSGNVKVVLPDAGPYRIDADTVSGDQEIGVRSDPGARSALRVRTTSGDLSVGTG